MAKRTWSDLSERTRRLLLAGMVAEGTLKAVALADLKRRPAGEVRGPKWRWALAITVVNCFGAMPLAYFVLGRRRAD
ncbi:MAG TPA: hypothetical protein VFL99_07585 [Segeticoccus sp.]|nr:hypothetical protein [Segeticoccus sp.]